MDALPAVSWPLQALPGILRSGRFPLDDRGFDTSYRSPTHALHLYEYHGAMQLCGRTIAISPGDLTWSPAGGETRYDLSRRGHHWCVHFQPAAILGATCRLPVFIAASTLGVLKSRVIEGIQRMSGLLAAPPDTAALASAAACAVMQEVILTIAAHIAHAPSHERAPKARDAVARAAGLIDDHLDAPLSARAIAARVDLSPNWLARAFRERFGTTMSRYLTTRRIALAQELLVSTDLPMRRIADRVGFHDAQHFNKQFHRVAGCSPTAFRLRGQ